MLNSKYIRYHIGYSDYPDNYILRSRNIYSSYIRSDSICEEKIGAVDYGCDNDGKIVDAWLYSAHANYEYGFMFCFEI